MNDENQYEDLLWIFFYLGNSDMYGWVLTALALSASLFQTRATQLGHVLVASTNLLWAMYSSHIGSHEETLLFFGLFVIATFRLRSSWKTRPKRSSFADL